ncbi:ABC-F family ATP-binding cassette domain-containing protein [Treponema parvum]|uniref:ABC-F family ATP-binding cassette domain-containing protein n=1 Tax=Treponema parvum TaxID=138851 RepID=UPI001AEC3E56|nr:ABC-F family ATP-binding cassette domain-containing protein [Treponema parvum]QTQ15547.1 ABC-F family ATP-binding cassette domain-containing protein [Treponema parvum]
MNILSINALAMQGRESPLFTDVSFGLNYGEKAAVIGKNGSGKSTLLKIIAGILQPSGGSVVINKEAGVSFLPQDPSYNKNDTILDHIFKSPSPKLNIIRKYEEICEKIAFEGTKEGALDRQFEDLNRQMEEKDLWNYESQISSILTALGIKNMQRKMSELSGGMIKKVALAQVLAEDTKLLLLDEPTNHLDIRTISYLQDYLASSNRTVLMVTHDRYFLDNVCDTIYELERGTLKYYKGNYSSYLEKKQIEAEIEANADRRIESVLRTEREWLLRGPCARGTKAKARIQRDMQLINREKFKADKEFSFEVSGRRSGKKILELHGIGKNFPKGYAEKEISKSFDADKNCKEPVKVTADAAPSPVLKNFSYTFSKGQKIGIFGDNGTGKSTLVNIITGKIPPDSGSIVKGENTIFAHYEQNPVFPDKAMTVLEYVKEAAEIIKINDKKSVSAARFLEEFGFEGKIQYSPVSALSGGEKKRLLLVRLLIGNPNFLILDEPTNDFDIFTMNILERFLTEYEGCLLVISHDRYFMDKVADTLFILEDDGSVSSFAGKCSQYIMQGKSRQKHKANNEDKSEKDKSSRNKTSAQSSASSGAGIKKLSFKEQKEFEQIEKDIETLEKRKKELENIMSDGKTDFSNMGKISAEYQTLFLSLEKKYKRWEELA